MSDERMNDSLTRRILKLRAESYGAGDHTMGDICDIALGNNDETSRWSRDNAVAECERVLTNTEAQSSPRPSVEEQMAANFGGRAEPIEPPPVETPVATATVSVDPSAISRPVDVIISLYADGRVEYIAPCCLRTYDSGTREDFTQETLADPSSAWPGWVARYIAATLLRLRAQADGNLKVVRTRVTNDQLEVARGGYDPEAGFATHRLWVSCPAHYDADAITAEDILGDSAVRVVDRPAADAERSREQADHAPDAGRLD